MVKNLLLILILLFPLCSLSKDIQISSSEKLIKINGIVKYKNVSVGNTNVSFINSQNEIISTKTDFSGKFSISLPKTKYRIIGEKFGYRMEKKDSQPYDFSNKENNDFIIINLTKLPTVLEGRIIDQNDHPVPMAEVKIKSGDTLKTIQANRFGIFQTEIPEGLISVYAEKPGYFGNGTAVLVVDEILRNNLVISLQQKLFSISGVVSDGYEALANKEIFLIDANTKFTLAKTKSSEIGYYEFLNIPGEKNVEIKVPGSENYSSYLSEDIKVESNIKNYNIFLE